MSDNARWVLPFGSAKADGYDVAITPEGENWQHTGLYAVGLAAGERREIAGGEFEYIVVPLSGSVSVDVTGRQIVLAGRDSVFAGPTDVAYVPRGAGFTVSSARGARVAVAFARAAEREQPLPARHVHSDEVQVELRGAGQASREVRNFGTPQVLEADSIIACEVITPAGNWSSYPPHKHDEEREGEETELEEIYYFELQPESGSSVAGEDTRAWGPKGDGGPTGGGAPRAFGYQRVYGTAERPIDILAEVRTGDVVLVPHGWHGPAMAPPGYDLYYLNVMAGPGATRAWLICDDPAHAWVRDTWADQDIDPRLPLGGAPS
ncbi:MAG TPA: 5-deoxy-glucuronate isomerase [Dermatophilaceae bacterium]|jgi:5-deoxy-glucuronate isomerase|nr:5-deoxy-glucuronate isomerase [Dermatophilaceae bacterium]